MRVTDEMVQAALDAQPFTADNIATRAWQCIECDGDRTDKLMRSALEAALSHAAGQEVDVPEGSDVLFTLAMLEKLTSNGKAELMDDAGNLWGVDQIAQQAIAIIQWAQKRPAVARSEGEEE